MNQGPPWECVSKFADWKTGHLVDTTVGSNRMSFGSLCFQNTKEIQNQASQRAGHSSICVRQMQLIWSIAYCRLDSLPMDTSTDQTHLRFWSFTCRTKNGLFLPDWAVLSIQVGCLQPINLERNLLRIYTLQQTKDYPCNNDVMSRLKSKRSK